MTDRRLSEDHPRDPQADDAGSAVVSRIRTYLEALPGSPNLGAEFAYSGAFRSEGWPHAFYPLLRTDLEALLARVEQLTTERDGQRVQLTSAADALSAIARAVIAVEPALKVPYSDAPEHSPWSRFVERPTRTAYNLGRAIKRSLREIKESPDA